MHKLGSGCALLLLSALILTRQETVDEASIVKLRAEALERSQIMHTVHNLSDRYGPRVTGTPNHEQAAKWAIARMTQWGQKNAHLEPWDLGAFAREMPRCFAALSMTVWENEILCEAEEPHEDYFVYIMAGVARSTGSSNSTTLLPPSGAFRSRYNLPMPNEHFERQMAFIIDQQAKFTVDIRKLQEAQGRTDGMLRQLIDVNLSLANHVGAIDERLLATDERLLAFDERLVALDERLLKLAESQAHTDRRLDALIDVVDKLARRDGGSA